MRRAVAKDDLDLAAAVTAGPAYWGWQPVGAADVAASLAVAALLAVVATHATAGLLSQPAVPASTAPLAAAVWGSAALWAGTGVWAGGRIPRLWLAVGVRLVALVTLIGLWGAAHVGQLQLLQLWPLGAAVGLEAAVTLRALGVRLRPAGALLAVLSSGVHAGTVLGLLGVALLAPDVAEPRLLLGLYAGALANLLVGLAAARAVDLVGGAVDRAVDGWRAEEAGRRANWIHDEVCGLLIPLRQQIKQGVLADPAEIAARLDDVDFELRQMQLAQTAVRQPLTVADLVQIWGRRIHSAGVDLHAPPWERTRARIHAEDTERAARVLGVAVPNALAAKASRIRIEVTDDGTGALLLAVSDDAGGFDADHLPPGRGLDRLLTDHPDAVEILPGAEGTTIRTRIRTAAAREPAAP